MRLIVARLDAVYEGRIGAVLDDGTRLVILKADQSVMVHADVGAYRPLVWMNAPNHLLEHAGGATDGGRWEITNRDGERLIINFHRIASDVLVDMDTRKGLTLDGVEKELQALLAEHPATIEEGMRLVSREFETGIGPIDLLCRDGEGNTVAVEIKRVGELDSVEQLTRYVTRLRGGQSDLVRGLLAATRVKPQARTLCEDRGFGWIEVDLDLLRGLERRQGQLF